MRSLLTAILASTAAAAAALAGPLTPPAGAIAASMKTLGEVEPRTAINATNTPGDADSVFRISQPGSYYLTGNMTVPNGKRGIEIATGYVTIDMGGFTIDAQTANGPVAGIATTGSAYNITIRNGTVRRCSHAFMLSTCDQAELTDITADFNGSSGVTAGSLAKLRNVRAFDNNGAGITAGTHSVLEACVSKGNQIGIDVGLSSLLTDCHAAENTINGFTCTAAGTRFVSCVATHNGGNGFTGATENRFERCTAEFNANHGLAPGSNSTVSGCQAARNGTNSATGSGVYVASGVTRVLVESTVCTGNDYGIRVDSASNLVIGNRCTSNTTNFEIAAGNRLGAIVTLATSPAATGNSGGSPVGAADAISNLAY